MPVRKILLHIGYPKCASSSFQAYLAHNSAKLRKLGAVYPQTGRLKRGYRSHLPLFDGHLSDRQLDKLLDRIDREATDCERIILSSEKGLSSLHVPSLLSRIVSKLACRYGAENVTILVLVRRHADLAASSYAQFVRAGLYGIGRGKFFRQEKHGLEKYFREIRRRDGCYPFSYTEKIAQLRREVGDCPIEIISVHPSDLGCELLSHLAGRFDLPAPDVAHTTHRNGRFSARAQLAMADAYRRYPVRDVEAAGPAIATHVRSAT